MMMIITKNEMSEINLEVLQNDGNKTEKSNLLIFRHQPLSHKCIHKEDKQREYDEIWNISAKNVAAR